MPSPMRTSLIPAALLALVLPLPAQDASSLGEPLPLFRSHDPLVLRIEADFDALKDDRDDENEERPGEVYLIQEDGTEVLFPVQIRTRGRFRLQSNTCEFPPLRLNFKKGQLDESLFDGQDKLKLVTHCQDSREEYQQYVLQEYLIYRAYNLFTDVSFRVRPAQITYVDTERRRDTVTRYAFFLEDDDAMATRNGWDMLEVPQVVPSQMQQAPLALVEVFQFMIGNTDWDAFRPEPDDPCCHNTKLVGSVESMTVIPVPYDFDWAGIVDARYAKPNPELGIRSVRNRLYRGICRPREELDTVLAGFLERREAVYETFRSLPALDPRRLEDMIEYLDEFYEIIGTPARVEREIVRRCRRT